MITTMVAEVSFGSMLSVRLRRLCFDSRSQQMRMNDALRQMGSALETNVTSGLVDAISGTKSFGQAMQDTSKVVVRAIEQMIVQLYIVGPLMRSLQSGINSFLPSPAISPLSLSPGGISSGSAGGTGLPGFGGLYAAGAAFDNGNVVPFARGGVVTAPTLFPMASGAGLMGEAGPEAIVPLKRGPDGRLGVSASGGGGGGGGMNIVINNHAGADVQPEMQSDGSLHINVLPALEAALANRITRGRGPLAKTVQRRGGMGWG